MNEQKTLRELGRIMGGIPAPVVTATNGDVPFVRMRELGQAHHSNNFAPSAEYLTPHDAAIYCSKALPSGTILFPRSGSVHLNHRAVLSHDAVIVSHIAGLLPAPGVDPKYLYYLLCTFDMTELMTQTTGLNSIQFSKLYEKSFSVISSRPQQAKIAEVLATVDRALTQTDALLAKQQRVKAGLMQELLTRGIDADGNLRQKQNDNVVLYPGWKIKRLSEVAEVSSGVTLGQQISAQNTITLPYLRVFNVQDGYLNLSDVKTVTIRDYELDRYRLQKGDVLMNEGGDFDKLGRGAVWDGQIEPCLHQNHVFRVRANRKILLPDFLALISSSVYGKAFFVLNSKQSTNLASINSTQLKSFPVPCPDLKEQERILEFVGKQNRLQSESQRSYRKLKLLKAGLMQDLLTGRVSVLPLLDESE